MIAGCLFPLETVSFTVAHCSQRILLHCRPLFAVDCIYTVTVSCTSTLYCLTMHLTLVELFISTSKNYTMVTKTRGSFSSVSPWNICHILILGARGYRCT